MVVDVAEKIALGILVEGRAHVAPETPEDQPHVVVAVAVHGKAAQHDEAASVVELGDGLLEPGPRHREGKLLAADIFQATPARLRRGQRAVDVGDLLGSERHEPRRVAAEYVASPSLGTADWLHPDRAHRWDLLGSCAARA